MSDVDGFLPLPPRTKSASENAVVFAPTPSAATTIAVIAKPGARKSERTA